VSAPAGPARGLLRSLRIAIRFLSRLPLPGDHDATEAELARSVGWHPTVGLVVGGLLAMASGLLAWTSLAVEPRAALLTVLSVLITGGLHEDGLADATDGLGAGKGPVRALAIMRDSRVGAFGGLALVSVLLLRYAALVGTDGAAWAGALITSYVAARVVGPVMLFLFVYARPGEDGLAQPLIAGLQPRHVLAAIASAAALLLLSGGFGALLLLPLAIAAAVLLGGLCQRSVSGITGDLVGASIALTELVGLLLWAGTSPAAA